MNRSGVVLLALTVHLSATLARAATPDWPRFRGPDANPVGTSERLPSTWSQRDNVEWKAAIPGRGWSSPIVAGNRVFLTTVTTDGMSKEPQIGTDFSNDYIAELERQGLSDDEVLARLNARDIELPHEVVLHYFLYCLDLQSGRVLWKQEFHSGRPPGGRHRKNSFVSETPVSDGRSIFVYVANLGLYAFGLDGKLQWTTPLEAYPIYLDFGTGGSPALHENMLVVVNDNERQQFIAAFDKRTGKELWRTPRDLFAKADPRKSGWSSPLVWTHAERTEIVTVGPGTAVSYDLMGKELWRVSGMSAAPIPSPFVYDGLLYIDGGAGGSLFAVRPGASGDISLRPDQTSNDFVVWSVERAGTYLPTPLAYKGGIYKLSEKGILTRFDAKTGQVTFRDRLSRDGGAFTSSPWAYNDRIYCLSEEGQTFVVAADETFRLLHVNELDEMAQATPAIVGERLLVRTESKLYSMRQSKGG
jgi:outer membrane protein assembly factor BamB